MKKLALVIVLMLLPWSTYAQDWGYNKHGKTYGHAQHNYSFWQDVERCQDEFHWSIDRGIEKGQLTRREVKKLNREQRHLAKKIRHFKRHRYLSHADERIIMDHLDHVSDKIRHFKHNNHYARHSHRNYNNRHNQAFIQHNDYNLSAGIHFSF